MATWAQLAAFIRREYKVIGEGPDEIRILIQFGEDEEDERVTTQTVVVAREVLDRREEWVHIVSPFARVDQVNLRIVLEEIGNTTVVGGAAIFGQHVALRHSLPLINLDINEFIDPLLLVAGTADLFERQFVGRDVF